MPGKINCRRANTVSVAGKYLMPSDTARENDAWENRFWKHVLLTKFALRQSRGNNAQSVKKKSGNQPEMQVGNLQLSCCPKTIQMNQAYARLQVVVEGIQPSTSSLQNWPSAASTTSSCQLFAKFLGQSASFAPPLKLFLSISK